MHACSVSFAALAALLLSSLIAAAAAAAPPLVAPDPLSGSAGITEIELRWSDRSRAEKSYEVERAPGVGGSFVVVGETPRNATSYTDTGLPPGTTFRYRVRAKGNGNNGSAFTAPLTISTLPLDVDLTPPTVSISSPASGTVFTSTGTATIHASASDNVGIAKVEFWVNNSLASVDTSAPFSHSWSITAGQDGSYTWFARAYDAAGNSAMDFVFVEVAIGGVDSVPPSVTISSPASGSMYSSPQDVLISASASDNQGVARVEFLQDGALRHIDTSPPYSFWWSVSESDDGTHAWTARAYDGAGNATTSPVVFLTVAIGSVDTQPPSVTLVSPSHGQVYNGAQTVNVESLASDDVGVTRVEFFQNGILRATDTSSPYQHAWVLDESQNGSSTWSSRAYDAAGNSTWSNSASVTVNVLPPDETPPSISITSPATGTTYQSAGTVTMNATASDDRGVTKVEFYDGGVLRRVDTFAPYTNPWTITETANGSHSWTAVAYDAAGNTATSNTVVLIVDIQTADTTPPNVSITSPANGSSFTSAGTVSLTASASDNVGVTKVEFYDGGVLKRVDSAAPYTHAWAVDESQNGSHAWTAVAYDAAGNTRTSSTVTLTVDITPADTTPPTVAITSPANGSTFTSAGTVSLTAAASDNVGVTKVEFYDGGVLKRVDSAAPYTHAWAVDESQNGSHAWTAVAYDAAGNTRTSSTVTLTVDITAADTTPPSVAITSPASGSSFPSAQTVTIAASASDDVGVTKVEFYDGGVLKRVDSAAPYTHAWAVDESQNGSHAWTAKAYDAAGNTRTSSTVTLTVDITVAGGDPVLVGFVPGAGTARDVAFDPARNLAYVASDEFGLSVFDVSQPSAPVALGAPLAPFEGNEVAYSGTRVAVSAGDGLRLIDASNPALPVVRGIVENVSAQGVAISGNYAYTRILVPGNPAHVDLLTIDISNLANPTVVDQRFVAAGDDVVAANGKLYLTTGSGLQIFSLSNPAAPSPQGSVNLSGGTRDLVVSGSYAYVINNTTLHTVSISNANSPSVVSSLGGGGIAVGLSGSRLYALSGDDLEIYSLGNPAAPVLLGVGVSHNAQGVAADGTIAMMSSPDATAGGFYLVETASASAPSMLAMAPASLGNSGISGDGSLALASSADTGLWVVDVSLANLPEVIGNLDITALDVAQSGSYAYTRMLVPGNPAHIDLVTLSLANPSNPTIVDQRFVAAGDDVVVANGKLYVTTGAGLQIFSLSNPAAPSPQGSVNLSGGTRDLAVSGNHAYVVNNTWFHVIDVSNANAPVVVGSLSGGGTTLAHAGTHAYLISGDDFEVVSVANPSAPVQLGSAASFNAKGVAVSGNRAYLATLSNGVVVYDVSNPASPQARPHVPVPGPVQSAFPFGNTLYVGGDASAVSVIDLAP